MSLDTILESVNWLTVALAVSVLLISYAYAQWSRSPPGPMGLPFVGYYPFFTEGRSHVQLRDLSKKYGNVFCFKVTGQWYVHIMDVKTVREVAVTKSDCFDRRTSAFTLFKDMFGGGVVMHNGEEWKLMRKFFLMQFKEIGMGKKAQETVMQDSLKNVVSLLRKNNGKKFDGLNFFTEFSNDVNYQMIFGGVKMSEEDAREYHNAYKLATDFTNGDRILLAGPLLKYVLIPFHSEYRRYRKWLGQVRAIMTKMIRQHEREFDRNNIRNLIDSYINEKKSLEEKKDPKAKYFTEETLVSSIIQFFGDGTLGVTWLVAAILHILAFRPDVLKRMQSEVDEMIGRNRFPSWDDKSRLPYSNAVMYEGMRTTVLLPLVSISECTKETTIGGCRIPKGAIALYNVWAICRDPKVYDEQDKFNPNRFLSVDGKKPKSEPPILFGVGKRSCIGESLTMMQIFLFVLVVVQNFDLHPVEQQDESGIVLRATPRAL